MENNLNFLREEKIITQKQLCEELKNFDCYISRSAYAKYETGIRDIPCEILVKSAKLFNTTCNYILGV